MNRFFALALGLMCSAVLQSQLCAQSELPKDPLNQPPKTGSQAQNPQPAQPQIPPGGIRLTIRSPEDWVKTQLPRTGNATRQLYVCKPLACFNPASVLLQSAPTLARHPDPRALETLAQKTLPKLIIAQSMSQMVLSDGKIVTKILSSKVTELGGYPAIIIETSKTGLPKPEFTALGTIFAGPIMLTITSQSTVLADAKAHLTLFVSMVTFAEGPKMPNDVPQQNPPAAVDKGKGLNL